MAADFSQGQDVLWLITFPTPPPLFLIFAKGWVSSGGCTVSVLVFYKLLSLSKFALPQFFFLWSDKQMLNGEMQRPSGPGQNPFPVHLFFPPLPPRSSALNVKDFVAPQSCSSLLPYKYF